METPLFHDRFGIVIVDDDRNILELRWLAETEAMTDDDYMRWLERSAAAAVQPHASFLLIHTRAFKHHPGEDTWSWREEHSIPSYTLAGVKKIAFLLSPGTAHKTEPAPEGAAQFPTGSFDSRERLDHWLTSEAEREQQETQET